MARKHHGKGKAHKKVKVQKESEEGQASSSMQTNEYNQISMSQTEASTYDEELSIRIAELEKKDKEETSKILAEFSQKIYKLVEEHEEQMRLTLFHFRQLKSSILLLKEHARISCEEGDVYQKEIFAKIHQLESGSKSERFEKKEKIMHGIETIRAKFTNHANDLASSSGVVADELIPKMGVVDLMLSDVPAAATKSLIISNKVALPKHTKIYITSNQIIFYHYCPKDARHNLYVKIDGNKVDAPLIHDKIHSVEVHESELYFGVYGSATGLEVCRAYVHDNRIKEAYTRTERPDETFEISGICSRKERGRTFVNRISDSPEENQILVDLSANKLSGASILGIHRKRAIYAKRNYQLERPVIKIVAERAILLESPFISMYGDDSSPYCYFVTNGATVHTLDTGTMEFLPTLEISGARYVRNIANIKSDKITLYASDINEEYCEYYCARLPGNYFVPDPTTTDGLD